MNGDGCSFATSAGKPEELDANAVPFTPQHVLSHITAIPGLGFADPMLENCKKNQEALPLQVPETPPLPQQQLIEQQDSGDGRTIRPPNCKRLAFAPIPRPQNYLKWRSKTINRICQATKRAEECLIWLEDVKRATAVSDLYKNGCSALTGSWENVSSMVLAAFKDCGLPGEVQRQISKMEKDYDRAHGRILCWNGRMTLYMLDVHMKLRIEDKQQLDYEKLKSITMRNNDLFGCKDRFMEQVAEMEGNCMINDSFLETLFRRTVEHHPIMKQFMDHYKMVPKEQGWQRLDYMCYYIHRIRETKQYDIVQRRRI